MREVISCYPQPLVLGRRGERDVTRVVFDLREYIKTYGDGRATLIVKRPGDPEEYPGVLEREGTWAVWVIGPAWTGTAGQGWCQLNWYVGDTLAKSTEYKTLVRDAAGSVDIPEGHTGYLDRVLAAGVKAEDAAEKTSTMFSKTAEIESRIRGTADRIKNDVDKASREVSEVRGSVSEMRSLEAQAMGHRSVAQAAASSADAAANRAWSYSSNPPKIGENGNWWQWDGNAYVDTGNPSRGEGGAKGEPGASYELTEADMNEIAELVLSALPNAEEVAY